MTQLRIEEAETSHREERYCSDYRVKQHNTVVSQVSDFVRDLGKWGGSHYLVEGCAKGMNKKEEWRVEQVVGKLGEPLEQVLANLTESTECDCFHSSLNFSTHHYHKVKFK